MKQKREEIENKKLWKHDITLGKGSYMVRKTDFIYCLLESKIFLD